MQLEIGKVKVNEIAECEKKKLLDIAEQAKLEAEEIHLRRQQESEERTRRAMEQIDMMAAEANIELNKWKEEVRKGRRRYLSSSTISMIFLISQRFNHNPIPLLLIA